MRKAQYLVVSCILIAANVLGAYLVISLQQESLHAENGLLENVQAMCLGASVFGYVFLRAASPGERLIYLTIALLSFSFLLRELDLDRMDVPRVLQTLGSGPGRVVLLLSLWLALGYYARRSIRFVEDFGGSIMRGLFSSHLFPIALVVFFMLIGSAAMDKNLFSLTHSRLFEELFETTAYVLLMAPLMLKLLRAMRQRRNAVMAARLERA